MGKKCLFNFRVFPLSLSAALGERVAEQPSEKNRRRERRPYGNECLRRVAVEALSDTCTWRMLNNSPANFHRKYAGVCTYPRTCRRFCFLHALGPKHGH